MKNAIMDAAEAAIRKKHGMEQSGVYCVKAVRHLGGGRYEVRYTVGNEALFGGLLALKGGRDRTPRQKLVFAVSK